MDEPLGALDADFRETMRAEIKALHIAQKATTVYVTHDQIEAMAMGDRIVVMSDAVVQQIGTPAEVYHNPGQPVRRQLHRQPRHESGARAAMQTARFLPGDNVNTPCRKVGAQPERRLGWRSAR